MTHTSLSPDDGALLPLDAVRERPAPGDGAAPEGAAGAPQRAEETRGAARVARGTPGAAGAAGAAKGVPEPAARLPVARVAVDNPLPHLDRPFDYLVPATLDAEAVPGCRVRVRFAGKLVDGFLLERAETTEHQGTLTRLERVVSAEPVLTPEIARLARAVADRYAGTLADILRLAVPPRHARVEAETVAPPASSPSVTPPAASPSGPVPARAGAVASCGPVPRDARDARDATPETAPGPASAGPGPVAPPGPWAEYPDGPAFLAALAAGDCPRAVWTALPGTGPDGPGWPAAVAAAVRETLRAGRGALVVVPDGKDLALVDAALGAVLGPGGHVALSADLGPAERYRRWLRAARGQVRAVAGTRGAAFAPVRDLGLAVVWDDGDDLHAERLAPYPHAREVLALRAHQARAALLIGGYARTAEATQLIAAGWAGPITPARETVRARAPRVRPAGQDSELARDEAARAARLPSLAWRTLRAGLDTGPVLVQVPRRGYLPALACQSCRAPARCGHCGGPFALRGGHAVPYCRWCGRIAGEWRCPACGGARVRALVVGARRTAEELGRAFPSVPVRTSGKDGVLATVDAGRALVVATPGAEPVPEGGYAAAVLLDGWALLGRPDLRAAEETLRRWMNAAALLRPRAELVVLADSSVPAVQALLRWDPVTHAERELADRTELGFPPAVRMATLTGSSAAVREMLAEMTLPGHAQVLGPVPVDPPHADDVRERAMVRIPRGSGAALATALKGAAGVRSARKAPDVVKVCIDPLDVI
ncbi:primosomal protein N' (replication factor Y) [Streptosporangium becharense]|uniref:Probable replication restart protein PriA n=1 Tax=Streptosporangium becharense TaxID=1816182 RepID=A0A7W9IDA4_9ACTN|nr:primosomal protein N' [Streptosporangium becharense]MBB2912819.1 primosomal protein N' (replication factor Y) [Streptosporangium becharense]MBB5818356.1 primosomal protein N' (replication factor Y) [Streptosporangium becharense]